MLNSGTVSRSGVLCPARALGGVLIDTIEATAKSPMLRDMTDTLRAVWREAYESGTSIKSREIPGLAPAVDVSARSRSSRYPLMLSGPIWRMQLCPDKGTARFVASAQWLASAHMSDVIMEVRRIAYALWGRDEWKVSRIDLACDFARMHPSQYADTTYCVRRSHSVKEHAYDNSLDIHTGRARTTTGVTFGKASSRVQLVIYDKGLQSDIEGLDWVHARWLAEGWDGSESVMRVEARLRGRGLEDFPELSLSRLNSLSDFNDWAPRVWAYMFGADGFLRYCEPSGDSNRSRWRVTDEWRRIASVGTVAAVRVRSVTEAVRERAKTLACKAIMRGVVNLVADDASLVRLAKSSGHAAMASSQPYIVGLLGALIARYGDAIEHRALGTAKATDVDRATMIDARIDERAAWYAWQYEPTLSISSSYPKAA